jgi:hypothetical protein
MKARAVRGLLARLLIGVLVSTQVAMTSYACPGIRAMAPAHAESRMNTVAATSSRGAIARMDSEAAAVLGGNGGGTEYGASDPMAPNFCIGHCQLGQQKTTDDTAAQLPPAALLSNLYTLAPLEERVASAHQPPDAAHPPPAVPPHATLHCCWRN